MEIPKQNINEIYRDQLNVFVKKYEYVLYKFINYQDKVTFILDEKADTFYFSPKEKKIWIPLDRFLIYLESADNQSLSKDHQLKAKIGMTHEMSHFRDMLKEKQILGKSSMYRVLKDLSSRKIKISEKEYIPIGEMIHTFYNCMDDIIVNWEVIRFKDFLLSKDDFHQNYQKDNFADYVPKAWWSFTSDSKWRFTYVGEWKWTHEINLDQEVDYSKIPMYKAISYYFLRKEMVTWQKIKLPERLERILFYPWSSRSLSWKKSLWETQKLLDQEISKAQNSTDPKIITRYNKIKTNLILQKQKLELMMQESNNPSSIQNKLMSALSGKLSSKYDITQLNPFTISLEQIIQMLSVSQWKETDHALCVMPSLRYEIYNQIFEPLIETFILIDLLYHDPKDMDPNKWKWEWEWEWKWEWELNSDKPKTPISWKWTYNRSLEDQLKTMEEIDEYQKDKAAQDKIDKEKKDKSLQISSIIDDYNIDREDYNFTKEVEKNFAMYTQYITNMLYKELEVLDFSETQEKQPSRKWKLNYDNFTDELPSSILDWDFSNKTIYERSESIKKLQEEFKKVIFYFVIDISWSTDWFKWKTGIMNWIVTALTIAWKNVEKRIQILLKDPNYKIPIKFIIYTDEVVYPTQAKITSRKDEPSEVELVKVNATINKISGGTNDIQWWTMVSNAVTDDLSINDEYIQEIEAWNMKPVVLQIADSDVTDQWVTILREKILQKFWQSVNEKLMTKRIILWQKIDKEYSEDELEKSWRSDWKDSYLKDGRWQVVIKNGKRVIEVKEVWVRSKKDITTQIESIFKNFFADIIKKK